MIEKKIKMSKKTKTMSKKLLWERRRAEALQVLKKSAKILKSIEKMEAKK